MAGEFLSDQHYPTTDNRLRRALQKIGNPINGLINQSILVPGASPGKFGIAGILLYGNGPPASTQGWPGALYLDIDSGCLYVGS